MTTPKTPTRAEISDSDKWDLTHLYGAADQWSEDFNWIQRTYSLVTEWKGRLAEGAETLAACLEFEKGLDLKIERVHHYASLQLAEDAANPDYLARTAQLQNLLTKVSEAASFLAPEIQTIPDGKFDQFLNHPALAAWKTALKKIRRMKPYVLSEQEERLLALGDAALDGYDETFSQLTDVAVSYTHLTLPTNREV